MSDSVATLSDGQRWMLAGVGAYAQAASAVFVNGAAFLLPELTKTRTVAHAGLIVAMAPLGLMLTLVAWGYVLDKTGERFVLTTCLTLVCTASAGGMLADNDVILGGALFAGGLSAAGINSASGRLIAGWFPKTRRGTAMGVRQAALPVGVSVAAWLIPPTAESHGAPSGLAVPAVLTFVAAITCLVFITDPPRPPRSDTSPKELNPYRRHQGLVRIHVVSAMLVVPQVTLWTFTLLWLHTDRGWHLAAAGALITITQLLGAIGRVGAGTWSDRIGKRMAPVRVIALFTASSMGVLAIADIAAWPIAASVLVVASVASVADKGLAYTAVAERSGPFWGGRALGVHATAQYAVAAAVAPVFGVAIDRAGYGFVFAVCAIVAAAATILIPRD